MTIYAPAWDFSAGGTPGGGLSGYTVRQVLDKTYVPNGHVSIKLKFKAAPSEALVVDGVYVGHQAASGDAYDFESAPTQVLFSASSGFSLAAGGEVTSDAVTFTLDGTKDLVVAFYHSGSASQDGTSGVISKTGCQPFWKSGNDLTTVDATGYTGGTVGAAIGVVQLLVETEGVDDANTDVLMHFGDTEDADLCFIDEGGHAFIPTGNAQIDTAWPRFGDGSLLLDGTGDALYSADSDDWYLSGDFTFEAQVRLNALPGSGGLQTLFSQYGNANNLWVMFIYNNGSSYDLYIQAVNSGSLNVNIAQNIGSISTGVWYHFAFTRSGNNWRYFWNGALLGTTVNSATMVNVSAPMYIGVYNGTSYLNGWLDEIRISNGTARYTTSFDLPAFEFRPETWTEMLSTRPVMSTALGGLNGYTMVFKFDTTVMAGNATKLRFSFRSGDAESFGIQHAYVGHQAASGDAYDFAATPTEITFFGGSSGFLAAPGEIVESDDITFSYDSTKDMLIAIYVNGGTSGDGTMRDASETGYDYYYKAATSEAATVDKSAGYTNVPTSCATVWAIDYQYEAGTGWANIYKYGGVLSSSLAKVDSVAVASIAKVNGVSV